MVTLNGLISGDTRAYFYENCSKAVRNMDRKLRAEFNSRKLTTELPTVLDTMWNNRHAYHPLVMAASPGQTIEPVSISLKRAVLQLFTGHGWSGDDTGIPRFAFDIESLQVTAEKELRSLFASTVTLGSFLNWYLSQPQDITLTRNTQRTISRWRPYRSLEGFNQDALPAFVRSHIRNFEWPFMDLVDQLFPHDNGDSLPSSCTYIYKAICAWLWEQTVTSEEGQRALAYHLPTRAGAIRNILNLAENSRTGPFEEALNSGSASFETALQLITSPPQVVVIGAYLACDNALDGAILTQDELQFLLECDYSQNIENQRLLLVTEPTHEYVRSMIRDTGIRLEDLCLKMIVPEFMADIKGTSYTQLIQKLQSALSITDKKGRRAAIDQIAEEEKIGTGNALPILQLLQKALSIKVFDVSDFIIKAVVSENRVPSQIKNDDDEYSLGMVFLENLEDVRLGSISSLTDISTRSIDDLVSVALAAGHASGEEIEAALDQYPFRVSYDYMDTDDSGITTTYTKVLKESNLSVDSLISKANRIMSGS